MSHGPPPSAATTAFMDEIRAIAHAYPEANEEFPWGDIVYKVKGKVFVFMGADADSYGISVKLPTSGPEILKLPIAEPTGYGLGKSGWVSLRYAADAEPDIDLLRRLIDESYRTIAPKRLVKTLPAP